MSCGTCRRYRSCRFGRRGPGLCMDPTRFFTYCNNGTNDHEQPRSVPLVPMLFGGRRALIGTNRMECHLPHQLVKSGAEKRQCRGSVSRFCTCLTRNIDQLLYRFFVLYPPMGSVGFFLSSSQHSAEFVLPNNLHSFLPAKTEEDVPSYMKHQLSNHRDMQRSGTNNGAIPREGACSRPAKREG